MKDSTTQWTDYWSNEGAGGEVFVNREGEKHPALRQFWREALLDLPQGTRILDLACGAGSIYADIADASGYQLVAADLSEQAILRLKERMPSVETMVCSAADVPIDDRTFDIVVSQFGVEYAGMSGFQEAARLVATGGNLRLLCHIENGFIDARNQRELAGLALVASTKFIDRAIAVTRATASNNEKATRDSVATFTEAEPTLAAYVAENPYGFHAHLYQGFRKMFCNRERYDTADIVSWLNAMREEQAKAEARIGDIRAATLSEDDVEQIRSLLEKAGLQNINISPFSLPDHAQPVAWLVKAER